MDTSYIDMKAIAAALGKPKKTTNGYDCQCPSHQDHKPSLSLSLSNDNELLFKCHAGCTQDAIGAKLRSLGLWKSANTGGAAKKELVATYDYHDEHGCVKYQALRYLEPGGDKTFQFRRPEDGTRDWIYNLKGVNRVLYRLPQLLEAKDYFGGVDVFVVEGEKDADNLIALGLIATTNCGGAGKWLPEYTESLKGVNRVFILPDNDEPGRDHAEKVAASCHAAGIEVRIVVLPGLPPKGDVSDFLTDGGTSKKLLELCAEAPLWSTAADSAGDAHADARIVAPPDWSKPETFGEPLLFGEIETPEINSGFLPGWLRDYVEAVAAQLQMPVGPVAMLVLSVVAACIQKRFEVSPFSDGYTEPLSIWALVALPPGSRKTALLQALIEPVIDWEREELKRLTPEIERDQSQRAVIAERIKELTRLAGKAEDGEENAK